jgi:hypothetical protein
MMQYIDYLRELGRRFKRQEEREQMHTVKFDLGDAPKPRKLENGLLALRAPLSLDLKAGQAHLDLGIKCDHALLLLPGRVDPGQANFVMPGNRISLTVTVKGDQIFDFGETVIYAVPLGIGDYEVA